MDVSHIVATAAKEERRRIRSLQRQALRELRALHADMGQCLGCGLDRAIRAIDRATRAPRKARVRTGTERPTSENIEALATFTPEQHARLMATRIGVPSPAHSASPANVGSAQCSQCGQPFTAQPCGFAHAQLGGFTPKTAAQKPRRRK